MEQRRETRFTADQPVELTVLGETPRRLPAIVKDASGRGLRVEVREAVALGAAVKIQLEDSILLGEAMYCRRAEDGYFVGIRLAEILRGLAELGRVTREFSEELHPAKVR
jgi:hypothetical protein